jgi:hypothetical protein
VVLDIDTDYLLAQGFADLNWPQVVATLNDPPNQAQLIGSDINSQARAWIHTATGWIHTIAAVISQCYRLTHL